MRTTPPEIWAAFRTQGELTEAMGRARQLAARTFRQWVGATAAQTSALELLELFGRGGFTRAHFEQAFPGESWTAASIARALGIPEEWVILPAGTATCLLRGFGTATVFMSADKFLTAGAARALVVIGRPGWAVFMRNFGLGRFVGPGFAAYYAWNTFADLPSLATATQWQVASRTGLSIIQGGLTGAYVGSYFGPIGTGIGAGVGGGGAGIITVIRANQIVNDIVADGAIQRQYTMLELTMRRQRRLGFITAAPRTEALTQVERDFFNDRRLALAHALLVEAGAARSFRDGGIEQARGFYARLAHIRSFSSLGERHFEEIQLCQHVFSRRELIPCTSKMYGAERQANEYYDALVANYQSAIRFWLAEARPCPNPRFGLCSDLQTINSSFPTTGTEAAQRVYLDQHLPTLWDMILYANDGVENARGLLATFAPEIYDAAVVKRRMAEIDQQLAVERASRHALLDVLTHIKDSPSTRLEDKDLARGYGLWLAAFDDHVARMEPQDYREILNFALDTLATLDSSPDPWRTELIRGDLRHYVPAGEAFRTLSPGQRLVATMVGQPSEDGGPLDGGLRELPIGWTYLGIIDGYAVSATPARNGAYLLRQKNGRSEVIFVPALRDLTQLLDRIAIPPNADRTGTATEFEWRLRTQETTTAGETLLSQIAGGTWEERDSYFRQRGRLEELKAIQQRPLHGSVAQILALELMRLATLANGDNPRTTR